MKAIGIALLTLISIALTAWGAPAIYYSDLQSEEDSTPRYYDKTFDLDQLDSVDLIASYWMGSGDRPHLRELRVPRLPFEELRKYSRIDMEAHAEAGRID